MSRSFPRRHLLLSGAAAFGGPAAAQSGDASLEITTHETATIDGRKWDTPLPGGSTVDAVHRSVLLRFPTAAEEIGDYLKSGRVLSRVELMLAYQGYEIMPENYLCRDGLGRKPWTENPPNWHLELFPLRAVWKADPQRGPTFNASVNGLRYWKRHGASDPEIDRVADAFDPQELSKYTPEARFDVTQTLATAMIRTSAGQRLRWLSDSGFLLRKQETYDSRYRENGTAYDWNMSTGGHGLTFANPRLIVSGRRTSAFVSILLPPATETELNLGVSDGSQPTALLPTAAQVAERSRRSTVPRDMIDAWQLRRLAELRAAGGDSVSAWATFDGEPGYKNYLDQIANLLKMPPRFWIGWEIEDNLLLWYLYREMLPEPLQDHLKAYWRAWLQPDVPTSAMLNPQSNDALDYWRRNRDWRGRASFFRDGFNYAVSTQNFNHTAAMGALLGGQIVGSPHAIGDGRHGLEHLPLRFWGFLDGTTQEILDHYYLSITLSGQKMFTDFAELPSDRLMGRILVDRTMEMLITLYHSRLRRFVSSSNRARISGVLVEQDGIYGAIHTISKDGAVKYVDHPAVVGDAGTIHGMPIWGYDCPPGRVAMQALRAPWAPSWMSGLVDDKPVPFEETSAETVRGFFKPPLWRRSWLGRWHGLASTDIRGGSFDVMGQWVRAARKSTALEDLGTLTARYLANKPDLVTTTAGEAAQAGITLTYQSRNRAIVFARPHSNRERLTQGIGEGGIFQLATVIALWNFAEKKDWKIYVDGKPIGSLPVRLTNRQRILIDDGVSYLAILPLPAADLGRDAEIEIGPGVAGKADPTGATVAPALQIAIYNLKRSDPATLDSLDPRTLARRTYGGFVLEMGDAEQHGSFDAFAKHIAAATLSATWFDDRRTMEVAYRTGEDLMEAAFSTDFDQPSDHFIIMPGQQLKAMPYRRLNGKWPYLEGSLERDTSWAQQGTSVRLEKNGAVLTTEAGRKAYLICDPLTGGTVGYNPLPDPQDFMLATKDGMTIRANGKAGLLRVEYRPWERAFDITHALKPDQSAVDFARSFTITGLGEPPTVTVNDKPVTPTPVGNDFEIAAF